jgi:hypothetical protein
MVRRIALLLSVGVTLMFPAGVAAEVKPVEGLYHGRTGHHDPVRFTYRNGKVHDFRAAGTRFDVAKVGHNRRFVGESDGDGRWVVLGQWTGEDHVAGVIAFAKRPNMLWEASIRR